MILIPFIAWANDRCTNPSAYTIDKRCYVTAEEKAQKPYNTTVALIDHVYNVPMCTGTIIQIQDMLVVYTAAHCIVFGEHKAEKIKIRLQDGREFITSHNNSGNYVTPKTDEDREKNYPEDWLFTTSQYKVIVYHTHHLQIIIIQMQTSNTRQQLLDTDH